MIGFPEIYHGINQGVVRNPRLQAPWCVILELTAVMIRSIREDEFQSILVGVLITFFKINLLR